MSTWLLYVMLTLPQLGTLCGIVGIISAIIAGLSFGIRADMDCEPYSKYVGPFLKVCAVCTIIAVIIPSKEIMMVLVGWELAQNIDGLSQLPADLVAYIRDFLTVEDE